MMKKEILDPCCGSKMFYFDKNDPRVLFCDNRSFSETLCDGRTLVVQPDEIVDFRNLPFSDGRFPLVIFDPPHLRRVGEMSWMQKKYGSLPKSEWKKYLAEGFHECWRVLKPGGTLVFKWNEHQIKIGKIEDIFPAKPIMGTRSRYNTIFVVFFKEEPKTTICKPKFRAGDTVRYKNNPKDEITILSVVGESYLVDDPGSGEPQYYSFDYVENNFEL